MNKRFGTYMYIYGMRQYALHFSIYLVCIPISIMLNSSFFLCLLYPSNRLLPIVHSEQRCTLRDFQRLRFPKLTPSFCFQSSIEAHLLSRIAWQGCPLIPFIVTEQQNWDGWLCGSALDRVFRRVVDQQFCSEIAADL